MIIDATGAWPAAAPGASAPDLAYVPEMPRVARAGLSALIEPRRPQFTSASRRPFKRFYEPRNLRVMTDALDLACRMLPPAVRESESLRRRLALHIMREVDAGERDTARLATTAVLSARI